MLPSERCSSVTRQGVIEVASIFSKLPSPPMSCCGSRSLATVTKGESLTGSAMNYVYQGPCSS